MMTVSRLHQISDSSDSSVIVKNHNCHRLKASSHKGLRYVSDSSDSFSNFSGLKRKNIYVYINIYSIGINRIHITVTTITKTFASLDITGFSIVTVPKNNCHRTVTTITKFMRRSRVWIYGKSPETQEQSGIHTPRGGSNLHTDKLHNGRPPLRTKSDKF